MKLKKIVSLALAGVLAVSMLAGCSNKTGSDDSKVETTVTNYSAEVGKLVEKVPEYVTFQDSSALTDALKKAAQYVGVQNVLNGYVKYQTLVDAPTTLTDGMSIKSDMLEGYPLAITGVKGKSWNIGNQDVLQKAEANNSGKTMEPAKAVELYVVSTAVGEDALKDMIAKKVAAVANYGYAVTSTVNNFTYEYTVSVSTCTKTVNSSMIGDLTGSPVIAVGAADPSVTFVAIEVVRTATHQ